MTQHPELPPNIGGFVRTRNPDGSSLLWKVVDEIRQMESDEKILVLQRLARKDSPGIEMLRFGYYILGTKPKMKGKWIWGQFAPFVSKSDFAAIVKEAKKRKWL
jgi:hypothetical protein